MGVRNLSQEHWTESETSTPSATELLDLFGDECTRQVFDAVSEKPRCGRAVAEEVGVARTTAYRHLDRLTEAGLVTTEQQLAPDGHHRRQFVATARSLSVSLDGGDVEAVLEFGE